MGNPIKTLTREHHVILRVLGSLTVFVNELTNGNEEYRSAALQYAKFFRFFADLHHHGKEEALLFQELEKQGLPADTGPIRVMIKEHDLGRKCVRAIASIGEGKGPLTSEEHARLREAILEFVPLLRNHMQKEDGLLFPMAERFLSQEAKNRLSKDFDEFDKEQEEEVISRKMHNLAESLVNRYTVKRKNTPARGFTCNLLTLSMKEDSHEGY